MKVPISQSYLIPVAFAHGFSYHHAVGDYAMLLKWLPQRVACKVPPYATHQVGVAGERHNHERLACEHAVQCALVSGLKNRTLRRAFWQASER